MFLWGNVLKKNGVLNNFCKSLDLFSFLFTNFGIFYQGITFEHAKEVRKNNLNPALFTYYKNPLFICKVHIRWHYLRYLPFGHQYI